MDAGLAVGTAVAVEEGLTDLETAICAWVSWFNTERLQSELTDRTPAEVEEGYYAASAHAAVA